MWRCVDRGRSAPRSPCRPDPDTGAFSPVGRWSSALSKAGLSAVAPAGRGRRCSHYPGLGPSDRPGRVVGVPPAGLVAISSSGPGCSTCLHWRPDRRPTGNRRCRRIVLFSPPGLGSRPCYRRRPEDGPSCRPGRAEVGDPGAVGQSRRTRQKEPPRSPVPREDAGDRALGRVPGRARAASDRRAAFGGRHRTRMLRLLRARAVLPSSWSHIGSADTGIALGNPR